MLENNTSDGKEEHTPRQKQQYETKKTEQQKKRFRFKQVPLFVQELSVNEPHSTETHSGRWTSRNQLCFAFTDTQVIKPRSAVKKKKKTRSLTGTALSIQTNKHFTFFPFTWKPCLKATTKKLQKGFIGQEVNVTGPQGQTELRRVEASEVEKKPVMNNARAKRFLSAPPWKLFFF